MNRKDIAAGDWDAFAELVYACGTTICKTFMRDVLPKFRTISEVVAWANEAPGEFVEGTGCTRVGNLRWLRDHLTLRRFTAWVPRNLDCRLITDAERDDFIEVVRGMLGAAK